MIADIEFENVFQESKHTKINTGIQQLYIIGLYDPLPTQEVINIFSKHLPSSLFRKLKKYVNSDPNKILSTIHWATFQSKLEHKDMTECGMELIALLDNHTPSENFVKTFHIEQNHLRDKSVEPDQTNTTKMVSTFLTSIYQRNILASLIKHVLLQPLIKTFTTSSLLTQKRGLFFLMHKRLQEIIFECVLIAFNGSNYDNYLLCNSLILIQSRMHQKIKIFKKGASISSILCINKTNFYHRKRSSANTKKILYNKWNMKLYIKDIRNLVSSTMTLDKVGKLFNLPVSKLVFPYNQATSINKIKNINSLQPNNTHFWKDTFFGKTPSLESRIEADSIFNNKKFNNLYEFGTFYLIQDCALLHSVVLTLFKSLLNQEQPVNIFLRRNYSQSSLAYQQFFIIEPSKQIKKQLSPKEINNTFYNYMIKQAVTGGLCTSFVHGKINENTLINEHFNYIEKPNLSTISWPNFLHCGSWEKQFNEKPSGISTLDIRSLYPSASIKKIPVNTPLFYSRFTSNDYNQLFKDNNFYNTLKLQKYCAMANLHGNHHTDIFKLISKPPRFYKEFSALAHYLQPFQSNTNIKILKFQSGFTAMGQLTFNTFPIDGFFSYKDLTTNIIHIKLIQYQSVFFHGHILGCTVPNNEKEEESLQKTNLVSNEIKRLCTHYIDHFKKFFDNNVTMEYVEISDCHFLHHYLPKNKNFLMPFNNEYNYKSFLTAILNKSLTGLIVVKNLKIKKKNQNPIFGFLIQKIEYGLKQLSPYTQEQINRCQTAPRVVSVHENKSFMVISTEYFNFLNKTFGFEETPDIYHGLFFQLDDYLRSSIEHKLILRKELKNLIKSEQNPEIR